MQTQRRGFASAAAPGSRDAIERLARRRVELPRRVHELAVHRQPQRDEPASIAHMPELLTAHPEIVPVKDSSPARRHRANTRRRFRAPGQRATVTPHPSSRPKRAARHPSARRCPGSARPDGRDCVLRFLSIRFGKACYLVLKRLQRHTRHYRQARHRPRMPPSPRGIPPERDVIGVVGHHHQPPACSTSQLNAGSSARAISMCSPISQPAHQRSSLHHFIYPRSACAGAPYLWGCCWPPSSHCALRRRYAFRRSAGVSSSGGSSFT